MTIIRGIEKHASQKKIAIYARVSSQKQKEGETIESQIDALRHYAKDNDYCINEKLIFLDDGVSGSLLQRPALDDLREIIRFEPIEVLLIYAPDRLSRNYTHQLILMEEFRRQGVKVHFLKNPPSEDTPEAKMFQHFQGIFAEYERTLILDRSRRGRVYKAKQGDPSIIPSVPYGYRKEKKDNRTIVVVVDNEAIVIKKIFYLYLHESTSLSDVARRISEEGIKPRKGGDKWDRATIRDILRNPTYTGTSYFGKTERCEGKSESIRKYGSKVYQQAKYARRKLSQEQWLSINVPAIISESDFEQIQEKLKKNKTFAARHTKYPSLLLGLLT
jgi:site-specific DNA recombinase